LAPPIPQDIPAWPDGVRGINHSSNLIELFTESETRRSNAAREPCGHRACIVRWDQSHREFFWVALTGWKLRASAGNRRGKPLIVF